MAVPLTLAVLEPGDETERLFAYLHRELVEEAAVTATELPTLQGTTVTVEFRDARPLEGAEARVREVLDRAPGDWRTRLEITAAGT